MEMKELLPTLTEIESSVNNLVELEKYFPKTIKIYEYNPTENRIIKTTDLNDVKEWLRGKANYNFIFQCLVCHKEMNFQTAFCNPNNSHLLTKTHKFQANKNLCIGLLYLSSKKFVMCFEKDFESGMIFQITKSIKRNPQSQLKLSLMNQVFCTNYSMFTYDRQKKTLLEQDIKLDMLLFMRKHIRPLFKFHCLLCSSQAASYTTVLSHLAGNKHAKKLGGAKGVIIAIRDFNMFVACDFEKLKSFIFLDHLNSCLEEIAIASERGIIISGCHSAKTNLKAKGVEISINVYPIRLPNGETKEKSIKVRTRYNNFIDSSENDSFINQLCINNPIKQRNFTAYEFLCDSDLDSMDNILNIYLCNDYKIWCSRCKKGIYSLLTLHSHLSSSDHINMIRNNEQVVLMCHFCNIFFLELKGEDLFHDHSSRLNKNIIKKLKESSPASIDYNTPLNKRVVNVYARDIGNLKKACKFCCYSCYDITKQNLMYLGLHEISECHKNLYGKCLFVYCDCCNVIYIDQRLEIFKLHFATHLTESIQSITFKVYDINGGSVSVQVDMSSLLQKSIIIFDPVKPIVNHKIPIRFSKYFIQFLNPGISNEFDACENWDNIDVSKYLDKYGKITGKEVNLFSCLTCGQNSLNKNQMISHLFISEHQKNQLYSKEMFFKICDICNVAILSDNLNDLQSHFTDTNHISVFSKKIGISSMFTFSIENRNLDCFMNMSKRSLINIISSTVNEIKTEMNRNNILNEIREDILTLLTKTFPEVTVTFYGSRMSGLAIAKSDFDICLNIGNDHLEKVKNLFETKNNYFKLIVCISESSVPIITAKHKASGAICDINLKYCEFKLLTAKLIKIFIDIDQRVLWLLAAVRLWFSAIKLKNPNMFSSQAITWLVLFYLMQPEIRIIPSVSYVMDHCGGDLDSIQDKDVISNVLKTRPQISRDKTWIDLLEGFFHYYSLMKFSIYKLYPLSGLVIPKNKEVPDENRPMVMMDPLDKGRNILFNAAEDKSEKLTAACYLSLHMPWRWMDD